MKLSRITVSREEGGRQDTLGMGNGRLMKNSFEIDCRESRFTGSL